MFWELVGVEFGKEVFAQDFFVGFFVLEEAGAEGLFKEACGSVLEGVIPGDESAKARRGAKDEIMRFDDSDWMFRYLKKTEGGLFSYWW